MSLPASQKLKAGVWSPDQVLHLMGRCYTKF